MSYQNLEKEIKTCIRSAISKSNVDVFESLCDVFRTHFEKPSSSIMEMRKKTTKQKGLIFEVFCKMYLRSRGYGVWMLSEVPEEVLKLGLKRFDMGIDLIATVKNKKTGEDLYIPVQCKYRKETRDQFGRKVHKVGWKEISTFISLCARTGPWIKNMIMTNADNVRWGGKKSKRDYVFAKKSFSKRTNLEWLEMIDESVGNKLGTKLDEDLSDGEEDELLDIEEIDECEEKKEVEEIKFKDEKSLKTKKSPTKMEINLLRQKWLDKKFK